MPNGGSDCCDTCWFNVRNKDGMVASDRVYHIKQHIKDFLTRLIPDLVYCEIRGFETKFAANTFCANHAHRNPERLATPIGPVFKNIWLKGSCFENSVVWRLSPDTEEIRDTLLELAANIDEKPKDEYPAGGSSSYRDEIVIWQPFPIFTSRRKQRRFVFMRMDLPITTQNEQRLKIGSKTVNCRDSDLRFFALQQKISLMI